MLTRETAHGQQRGRRSATPAYRCWRAPFRDRHKEATVENDRFDALTARLAGGLTRRRLGGLVALGAGAALTADPASGKRKKRKHKKHQQQTTTTTPTPRCPASCPVCQECVDGRTCTPVADETPCEGTGLCASGACRAQPTCISTSGTGCGATRPCCSGNCSSLPPFGMVCLGQAGSGAACKLNGDCSSGDCVAYRCA